MLGQALGALFLGFVCIWKVRAEIVIDTCGHAFTYPVFRLANSRLAAYVHYPTISSDMIARVEAKRHMYNNRELLARFRLLTAAKVLYYRAFARLYAMCGSLLDLIFVNSTWTFNHIRQIWDTKDRTHILYPPSNLSAFESFETFGDRKNQIVSISQFRPEKNHEQQIKALALLISKNPDVDVHLFIVGGCRNAEDFRRVVKLENLARHLKVESRVTFKVNIEHNDLVQLMRESLIGLHTMVDEHFGIGNIEFLAAGLIPIVNNSGGPSMDIVTDPKYGYTCSSDSEYVDAIESVLEMSKKQLKRQRNQGKQYVLEKFSAEQFETSFLSLWRQSFPE